MNILRLRFTAIASTALIAMFALTACGGGSTEPLSSSASGNATATAAVPANPRAKDLSKFFAAIFSSKQSDRDAAKALTSPGSKASLFVDNRDLRVRTVLETAGSTFPTPLVERVGDEYQLCEAKASGVSACDAKKSSTAKYSDITFKDGLVASFTVNGSDATAGIHRAAGSPVKLGTFGTIEPLMWVEATKGAPVKVYFSVKSRVGGYYLDALSYYTNSDGSKHVVTDGVGTRDFKPGATNTFVMAFKGAEPGGSMTVEASDKSTNKKAQGTLSIK